MQKVDGRLRPIAYASRKLNAAERHYSVTDMEALAVVWSLKHFREIILGYNIEVLTDHRPLCYLLSESLCGRQAHWIDTLLEFNPTICYTPGASNKVADSLSHVPTLHLDVLDRDDVRLKQRADPIYGELIRTLEADPPVPLPSCRSLPRRRFAFPEICTAEEARNATETHLQAARHTRITSPDGTSVSPRFPHGVRHWHQQNYKVSQREVLLPTTSLQDNGSHQEVSDLHSPQRIDSSPSSGVHIHPRSPLPPRQCRHPIGIPRVLLRE